MGALTHHLGAQLCTLQFQKLNRLNIKITKLTYLRFLYCSVYVCMYVFDVRLCPCIQFIHDYSEVDPGSHYQGLEMLTLTLWCLQITLNTLESDGHTCSLLLEKRNKRPSLQHQLTIDTFTNSIMESITGDVSNPSTPVIAKSRSRELLTPVPENQDAASCSKGQSPMIIGCTMFG